MMGTADVAYARGKEVSTMQFDLGITGLGLLIVFALGFGVLVQFLGRAGSRWEWLIAATGWFVGGLFASEVVWARATTDELQPIIDGLALDESLLGGLVAGVLVVLATRYVTGGSPFRRATSA
jgi:hypothetical protein